MTTSTPLPILTINLSALSANYRSLSRHGAIGMSQTSVAGLRAGESKPRNALLETTVLLQRMLQIVILATGRLFTANPSQSLAQDDKMLPSLQMHENDLLQLIYILLGGNRELSDPHPMQPAIQLEAPILALNTPPSQKNADSPERGSFPSDHRFATVLIGYGGYLPIEKEIASPYGAVLAAGVRCPIVEYASPNALIIDVTAIPDGILSPGWMVELVGKTISFPDLRGGCGLSNRELVLWLARVCARCQIRFLPSW